MTTKRDVLAMAERYNADVLISDAWNFDVEIVAPEGYHWQCGVHALVGSQCDGDPRSAVWADLLERMSDGIVPCDPTNSQCREWNADNAKEPTRCQ